MDPLEEAIAKRKAGGTATADPLEQAIQNRKNTKPQKTSVLGQMSNLLEIPMALKNALLEDEYAGNVDQTNPWINLPAHPFAQGFQHLTEAWKSMGMAGGPDPQSPIVLGGFTKPSAAPKRFSETVERYAEGSPQDLAFLAEHGDRQAQARLKSPLRNAIYTFGAESLNPSNAVLGEGLGLVGRGVKSGYGAIRATEAGGKALAPIESAIGSVTVPLSRRFNRFYDIAKSTVPKALSYAQSRVGERAMAQRMVQRWTDRVFGTGELSQAQKIEVERLSQGLQRDPDVPQPKVGKSLEYRGNLYRKAYDRTEKRMLGNGMAEEDQFNRDAPYVPHSTFNGRPVYQWVTQDAEGKFEVNPNAPARVFGLARRYFRRGHKTLPTTDEAIALGLHPNYDPAYQFQQDLLQKWSDIHAYENQMHLNDMPIEEGSKVKARVPIEYYQDTPIGRQVFGAGAEGEAAARKGLMRNYRPTAQFQAVKEFFGHGKFPNAQSPEEAFAQMFGRKMPAVSRMHGRIKEIERMRPALASALGVASRGTESVQSAVTKMPAVATKAAQQIYGSDVYASGWGKDADRYISDLVKKRATDPAYQGGGYLDEEGVFHETRNTKPAKGYEGKPFSQEDILDLRRVINHKRGIKLREDQVKDAVDRAFDAYGKRYDPAGQIEEKLLPLQKRAITGTMRVTDKFARMQKDYLDRLESLSNEYGAAKEDIGLKRQIQSRVDTLLQDYIDETLPRTEHLPAGHEEEFGGYKAEGGVARRESDLQLNMPKSADSRHTAVHNAFYDFIQASRDVDMPDNERTPFAKFWGLLANLARVGMILGIAPHGFWNLGTHYLLGAKDLGIGNSEALEHLTSDPGKFWSYASEKSGAQPNFNLSSFGFRDVFGRAAWRNVFNKDAKFNYVPSEQTVRSSPWRELPASAKIDKLLSQGVRIPVHGKNIPIMPGWNDNTWLVFDVLEHRYAAHLFRDAVEKYARDGGDEALADAAKVEKYGGQGARFVRQHMGDYANVTPWEKHWNLHRLFFFYPWMKTVVPLWTRHVATAPGYWNKPVHTIHEANVQQGDDNPSQNPFTVDLGKNPDGTFRRVTLPLPQRFVYPLTQAAIGAPIDLATQGVMPALQDLKPAMYYLEGHLNPNVGVPLQFGEAAEGVSNPYSAAAVDPYASPLQQIEGIAHNIASSYAAPLEDIDRAKEDPLGALGTFAAGGFLSSGQTQEGKARQHAMRAAFGAAIRAMRSRTTQTGEPNPAYDPQGADILDAVMQALIEGDQQKAKELQQQFLEHRQQRLTGGQ